MTFVAEQVKKKAIILASISDYIIVFGIVDGKEFISLLQECSLLGILAKYQMTVTHTVYIFCQYHVASGCHRICPLYLGDALLTLQLPAYTMMRLHPHHGVSREE